MIDSPGLLPSSLGWCWSGVITPDPELLAELIEAGCKFDICCAGNIGVEWSWEDDE